MELQKASLTNLENLEEVSVQWNPERYSLSRVSELVAPRVLGEPLSPIPGFGGGSREFVSDLLLDTTRSPEGERDLRPLADRIESWMDARPGEPGVPQRVVFSWGSFRFRGVLSSLKQVWTRFDRDGTPVRGWLRLTLRS
ncbi:MAG: hypothetical protein AAF517_06570 [Planctomycetota bacterium]